MYPVPTAAYTEMLLLLLFACFLKPFTSLPAEKSIRKSIISFLAVNINVCIDGATAQKTATTIRGLGIN